MTMRSLKSAGATTASTTTVKVSGKRKLAQTKEYLHSPPPSPPQGRQNNAKTLKGRNHAADIESPPAKRRRSSDRIAQKQGKKRTSMEDDDGFVFTRAPKQKRTAAVQSEQPQLPVSHKPFVMDFTADVFPCSLYARGVNESQAPNPFKPFRQAKRTPPPTDRATGVKDTIVALPISDTPIIRRNQHLREQATGRRRSSLSLRGNRTSSIGNGFEGIFGAALELLMLALPHPDVTHEDFHKHIKADFPEPVRMKQLLAWCMRRALDEQKAKYASTESSNAAAIGIAQFQRTFLSF